METEQPKTRKQEIQENRRTLKEVGIYRYAIEPTIQYWKQKPLNAITNFLMWGLITYTIFCGLQTINYELMYCNSTNTKYNGNIMDVYPQYIEDQNQKVQQTQLVVPKTNKISPPLTSNPPEFDSISCVYSIKQWQKQSKKISHAKTTLKKIMLKQK